MCLFLRLLLFLHRCWTYLELAFLHDVEDKVMQIFLQISHNLKAFQQLQRQTQRLIVNSLRTARTSVSFCANSRARRSNRPFSGNENVEATARDPTKTAKYGAVSNTFLVNFCVEIFEESASLNVQGLPVLFATAHLAQRRPRRRARREAASCASSSRLLLT